MTIDKKTYNAIKSHLLSRKQIVLASFSEQDVQYIITQLQKDGLNIVTKGNSIQLVEEKKEEAKPVESKEVKPETKEETKSKPKPEEAKEQPKEETQKVEQKIEEKKEETKTEQKQKPKKSVAVHIRLPVQYVEYLNSININITFALKTVIYEHAKAHNVTLPEPKQTQNGITKKEKKMLKECLNLATKEEILQCLQSKLT